MNSPIFIPSKGRWQYCLTMRALDALGLQYRVIVESHEYKNYASRLGSACLIVLDDKYKSEYELCDSLGLSKSTGPGPARNMAWDIAKSEGHTWHWVMDDNIRAFYVFEKRKRRKTTQNIFALMEAFCNQYSNVLMAGPNYKFFVPEVISVPPVVINTRIYSCNLILNSAPFRWRGRYNEDTILSLDMLSAGYCTIQFNAFLQDKLRTQTIGGGNTQEFYAHEGTLAKSRMLVEQYPQYARMTMRYGRPHHYVDYGHFRANKLRRHHETF